MPETISPLSQVFTAVQKWQLGQGSSDEAAELALVLADGDEDEARTLLHKAAALWATVQLSAARPYRSGEDGADIGPAHGRARKTAAA